MDFSAESVPSRDDFPEVPFVTSLRQQTGLERSGFDADFPILLDQDVRYAIGNRGRSFGKSIKWELYWDSANSKMLGAVFFSVNNEGPPGCVHGGAIATCLDSFLGWLVVRTQGFGFVTLNLNTTYRKFVPLGSVMKLEAYVTKVDGKKISCEGRMVDGQDGTVHAEATAVFYQPKANANGMAFDKAVQLFGAHSGVTKDLFLEQINKSRRRDKPERPESGQKANL
eukprot:TRINITY_DN27000_c0_g1_i1.p1 TRINITY_DN27000_c0_g1~~TRINITY_DN27000_c0_g1_i1.p1  ORF type:complete len:226 (-),score=35.76 TRINITY_DN27000_c0_g1_i1:163-840(-)